MNLQEKSQNFFQNYAFFGRKSRLSTKIFPNIREDVDVEEIFTTTYCANEKRRLTP